MNIKKISLFICMLFLLFIFGCTEDDTPRLKEFAITFIGNNNENIQIILVEENKKINYPEAPIVEGYEFIGWDQNLEYVTADTTIKALYQVKVFNVTFYDYYNNVISTQKVEYNKNALPPELGNIDGYEFTGWNQDYNNVKSDLEIKAIYDKTYTVKFFDYNNNLIIEKTVKHGSSVEAPNVPTVDGYEFIGWNKNLNNITSNLVINALYKASEYTVKFYDADNNVISTQNVLHGKAAQEVTKPQKNGYTFEKWDTDFNKVTSNLDIKPIFKINKYVVKFYDANNNVISTQEIEFNSSAIAPSNPSKNGYTFIGWNNQFDNVTSDLNIYPIFKENTNPNPTTYYTVKFYDANNNVISTQTIKLGNSAVEPSQPTKVGYTFTGWDKVFDYVTSNLDIYPIFKQNQVVDDPTTYTVTFLDNKGNTLSTSTVKKGEAAKAPTPPTISFYKFVKWDTDFSNVTSNLTVKPIYEKTHTTYAISDVNYWLQILTDKYDLQEELLNRSEINAYNQKVLSDYTKTKVLDVTKIASTTTGSAVKELINRYTNISKYTVYNSSTKVAITSTEKNTILNNRALTNISSTVTVKYGLIVDFAWVRSYPTNHYSNDYYMDRFQETSLNVGEAVAIYHTSSDGNWYFVQAQNYNGWVEKKFIAECSYSQMTSFLNPTNRLVVISNYETIEGSHVRMGQSFPLLSQGASYQISFPTRNSSGNLVLKTVTLTNKDSYSVGYLPYTYENVFKQAFKLLGINYSWGDKEQNGRDCSSTMNAIYACFGFMMPRNTSNQVSIPTYGTKISGITSTIMKTYKPGTLIFTSSHVMMYIGENEKGVSYLLHNTNSGNGECILQSLDSYGGSKIIGTLKLQ